MMKVTPTLCLGESPNLHLYGRSSSEDALVFLALARLISESLLSCSYYSGSSFGLRKERRRSGGLFMGSYLDGASAKWFIGLIFLLACVVYRTSAF